MVAQSEASKSCFSINHGAGRVMGRKAAFRSLDQRAIDDELDRADVLTNCRFYPRDEAPAVYKVDIIGANHTHFANICDTGNMLIDAGFTSVTTTPLLAGAAAIHVAQR